jgi:hypothetical protein
VRREFQQPGGAAGQRIDSQAARVEIAQQRVTLCDTLRGSLEIADRGSKLCRQEPSGFTGVFQARTARKCGDVEQQRSRAAHRTSPLQLAQVVVEPLPAVVAARENHGVQEIERPREPLIRDGDGLRRKRGFDEGRGARGVAAGDAAQPHR